MKKSKRVKKTNFWKFKQNQDHFFKKSKVLGYRSRASFKLIELNDKFKFIKKNSTLVDLGAYPGGWSQVAENIIVNGKILAVDIKNMEPLQNTQFLNCDILNPNLHEKILSYFDGKLDVVISDMAADTTGSKALDCIRTNQLCTHALNLSLNLLKPQGVFVSKLFMGEDFIQVKNLAKSFFKYVNFFKPNASKNESKETYLHCKILKTL